MTTSEFTPPAELTEGNPVVESSWRSRIWMYGGLAGLVLLLLVLAVAVVPALMNPEAAPDDAAASGAALAPVVPPAEIPPVVADPPVAASGSTDATASNQAPQFALDPATLDPEKLAAFEQAIGMSFAEFSALSDEEAWEVMWGQRDEGEAAPALPVDPPAGGLAVDTVAVPPQQELRQQMLDDSNAAGPGELPMTDEAADRAMVAVGLTPVEGTTTAVAVELNLVLVGGTVNTGGGTLNVRRQPGLGAPIVGQVSNGSSLDLSAWATAPDGGIWVRIQDPNAGAIDQGWVFALLVNMDDEHTALPLVTDFN